MDTVIAIYLTSQADCYETNPDKALFCSVLAIYLTSQADCYTRHIRSVPNSYYQLAIYLTSQADCYQRWVGQREFDRNLQST